ncbi:MAG: NnrS family protein [Candidatus Levyibacteriota bacterium]
MPKPLAVQEPELHVSAGPARFALWALAFRPFYLVASVFAALSIPLWVAQYAGWITAPYLQGPLLHGHEMLFGYTLAVIAGFLFTAGRTWTGQPTPTGPLLVAFVLLWLAGRVLVFTPWETAGALANAAFPLAVAVGLAVPLARSRNRRNYFFVALLLAFALTALALHLSYAGALAWPALLSLRVGLDLVLFIIAVMGGRVIPMFTNNGVPGTGATRHPAVEKLALGSVLVLLAGDLLQARAPWIAVVALVAALAHAVRLGLWRSWRTFGAPLVWVLHLAYGWIVVYLLLRALSALGMVAEPLAIHALTIGAIGGMTMGMITRTARGHTGRRLVADRFEVACFVLIQMAALIRVFGGMLLPNEYLWTVVVSGICWSIAFAVYAIRYWPILSRARIDGKPG